MSMNQQEPEVWGPEAHEAIERELVRGTLRGDLRPELRYRVAEGLEGLTILMAGLRDALSDAFAKFAPNLKKMKEAIERAGREDDPSQSDE